MSTNNELLRALHMERLGRLNNKIVEGEQVQELEQEQHQEQDQDKDKDHFECPVCYTDGSTTGLVTPVCGHKVCLACYSTMLLGNMTKCPCCRRKYLSHGIEEESDEVDYSDMPPLISHSELHALYDNLIPITAEQHAIASGRPIGYVYRDEISTAVSALVTLSNDRQITTLNTIAEFIHEMNQIQVGSLTATAQDADDVSMPTQRTME